jgi:hypothetical protein
MPCKQASNHSAPVDNSTGCHAANLRPSLDFFVYSGDDGNSKVEKSEAGKADHKVNLASMGDEQ